jgi:cysteine-rich repeat protein/parallel beta-helix repeat protein
VRDATGDDAGQPDPDAGVDAGPNDAGPNDAGPNDAGFDAGLDDAGLDDAGPDDAGPNDAGFDAGPNDAGPNCGDGFRELNVEACDPGSGQPGAADGCTTSCTVVDGWVCGGWLTRCVEQLDGGPPVVVMPGGASTLLEAIQLADPDGTVFVSGGPYDEYLDLGDARATVIADGPVALTSPGLWVVRLAGTTTNAAHFEGFEISNANGGGVLTDTDTSSVSLVGNRIGPTTDFGIRLRRGTNFRVERNFVFDNANGGVRVERSPYTVVNNIVVNNGAPGSDSGGIRVRDLGAVRFNTVVGNFANDTRAGGIECESAGTVAEGNYVVANGVGPTLGQLAAECVVDETLVGPSADAGPVDASSLGFIDSDSYRLKASAECVDYVTADAGLADDIDGDPRPAGAGFDCGADEFQ